MRPAETPDAQPRQSTILKSIDGSNLGGQKPRYEYKVVPIIHLSPKSLTVHKLPIPHPHFLLPTSGGRIVPSITSSRNNILHLKQSCKCLSLRQRRSTITLPVRMADKRPTRRGGPYHKLLTSVDAPRVAAGAEVELGRDVCVHPVPFARYGCAGVVWARVSGLLGFAGEVGLECSAYC